MKINQVVIWGYPLGTHTHGYIHASFKKAFEYLGYQVKWLTDQDNINGINFDYTLFITAGSQEKNIPLNNKSYYVLHNVNATKYLNAGCKVLFIQTHVKSVLSKQNNCERLNKYTLIEKGDINCIYMAWATNLLPSEIDVNHATNQLKNKNCVWIGTFGGGNSEYENGSILYPYFQECEKNGIKVLKIDPWSSPISDSQNFNLVKSSFLAPALQGPWQVKNEYIPCRIFKNISYGHFGITNNPYVNEIFDNKLVFDLDPIKLAQKSIEKKNDPKLIEEIKFLMNEVKEKHTYLNRVSVIMDQLKEL